MVVETQHLHFVTTDATRTFNPPLAGMVVETHFEPIQPWEVATFNPPLAGMVVETTQAIALVPAATDFQPTPSWDGC